jgi:SAM-dependent methyltransferase
MSEVFDAYARYYDLVYRDKDYAAEAGYVASRIAQANPAARSILELGCGTGAHAEPLAKLGYQVHGVDRSAAMVARAEERRSRLPREISDRLSFSVGDVRTHRTGRRHDAVISLFHVMSYLTSAEDLDAAVGTAYDSLAPGGLFFFDFWYGPAVLLQRPEVRVRRLEDDEVRVTRIAEPLMHTERNVVDVEFTVFVEHKGSGTISRLREVHPMRYLFLPELQSLVASRFEWVDARAWMSADGPRPADWAACVLLRRRP